MQGAVSSDPDHLVGGRHLEVEPLGDPFQTPEVMVLDVPAILTKMDGDAGRPRLLGVDGRLQGIRLVDSTGLPDGGDMVDVHAELGHRSETSCDAEGGDDRPHAGSGGQEYTPSGHSTDAGSCMNDFERKHSQLHDDLLTQGERVVEMALQACIAFFEQDETKAATVIEQDTLIDQVDVDIERASIKLLLLPSGTEYELRSVLTIVKINNELERIADGAVSVA